MPTIQEIQDALSGRIEGYRTNGAVDWQSALGDISNYARMNNLDPSMVAQAANNIPGSGNWDASKVRQTMAQFGASSPNYGLTPSLNTLQSGGNQAQQILGQTQSRVSDLFKQGMNYLNPYAETGTQANQLQAALSGSLGPQAQQQAYANYQQSPGVQFALDQSERALTRNAAALGGLGGGNVRDALVRNATGYALQDFDNSFNRIGTVADRGFNASGQMAGMTGQEAAIQSNLGQASAGIPLQVAGQQSGYQMGAGQSIANNVGATSSALANLLNQQGAGTSDLIGGQVNQLNTLYQNAANGDSNAQMQLAQLLSSVNMQAAQGVSGLPTVTGGQTNNLGQLGQVAGGIGGLLSGLNLGGQPNAPSGPSSVNNTNPGYGPSYVGPYQSPNLLAAF